MVGNRIFRFLFAGGLILFGSQAAFAGSRIAPDHIALDGVATIEMTIPGGGVQVKSVPKVAGLDIGYSGTSSQISIYNGKQTSSAKVEFSVEPKKYGNFTIPPITFTAGGKEYKTKTFKLKVSKNAPKQGSPFGILGQLFKDKLGKQGKVKGEAYFTKQTVFAGEPVALRYHFGSQYLEGAQMRGGKPWPPEFEPKGTFFYTVNDSSPVPGKPKPAPYQYPSVPTVALYVIPDKPGTLTVKEHVAVLREKGFGNGSGSDIIEPVTLKVLPLPKAGRPKNFSGNVGQFEIAVSQMEPEVTQHEEIEFYVIINGTGNFVQYELPRTQFNGIKLIDKKIVENKRPRDPEIPVGNKQIRYRVSAAKAGVFEPGTLYTNWFDPYAKKYREKIIDLPRLKVTPAPAPEIELAAEDFSGSGIFLPAAGIIVLLALGSLAVLRLNPRLLEEAGIKLKTVETPAALARQRDELVFAICGNKSGLILERYLRSLGLNKGDMNRLTNLQTNRLKVLSLGDDGGDLVLKLARLKQGLNKYMRVKKLRDSIRFLEELKARI